MNEENLFQNNADKENLLRLLLKRQSIDERAYAIVRELVRPLVSEGGNLTLDTAREMFNRTMQLSEYAPADFPGYEKQNYINSMITRLTACMCIDELSHNKHHLSDFLPASPPVQGGVIAYLKNQLADKAYKSFSKHVQSARVAYPTDFNGVCEAVYYEKADYCILPIENSNDGRLNGFYNLIEKYELFICLCTDVYSPDASAYTKFALCQKSHSPFSIHKRECDYYAELLITPDVENSLSGILFCADFLNVKTIKTECMPAMYSENDYNMYVTFCGKERDLYRLLMFFALQQVRYSYIGIYTCI